LNKKQEKLKKKKEAKEAKDAALRKEKGEDDEGGKSRKSAIKGASIDGDGAKKGKKRKLDGDAEKAPNAKKKKKDEPKQKGAKPKGPVDVERQCGVSLPNGGYCARSLTCKSHSMGLKRAVPGRSLPYDMLLAQYQKKNQAKIQRTYHTVSSRRTSCADAFQDLLSTQTRPFRKISSHQALSIRTKKKTL
jgi:SAGA-associated factor 73